MTKKQLQTKAIANELAGGASLFFSKPSHTPLPRVDLKKTSTGLNSGSKKQEKEIQTNPISTLPEKLLITANEPKELSDDGMTSCFQDAMLRTWKDTIENTETHNSSLRLTNEENYAIEDLIRELERSLRIKTSLNEAARLGLLYIHQDFKINREQSLIYKVKKS